MKTIFRLVSILIFIVLTSSCVSSKSISSKPQPLNSTEIASVLQEQGIAISSLYLSNLEKTKTCWVGHSSTSNLYFIVDLYGQNIITTNLEPLWRNVPEDIFIDEIWYIIKYKRGIILFIPQ